MYKKAIESFNMMWDSFPEGVMLIDRTKTIVAVNKTAANAGLKPAMVCAKIGGAERHKGCLALHALKEQEPKYKKIKMGEKEFITFWLPVSGEKDLYLHFSVGMTVDYGDCSGEIQPMS